MADTPRRTARTGPRPPPARVATDDALSDDIFDALRDLPDDQRTALTAVLVSQEFHSGPVPSPSKLAEYKMVLAEAPREIFDMANREQTHQNEYRDRALDSEISYRLYTLVAAFIIIFTMIVGAIVLGMTDHEKAAVALGAASGLTLIAGAFLRGRNLFPKGEAPKAKGPKPRPDRQVSRQKR